LVEIGSVVSEEKVFLYFMRKEKHMAQTQLLTDSTRKRHKKEDIASFVKKKKKEMPYRPTPFFNTYTVSII
jgi:hypothetical protein